MLLVNKTQRIIQLSEVNKENKIAAPTLIPVIGTIEIDNKRWDAIKKDNKVIQSMIEEGWLEEISSEPKKALSDLKPKDAIEVVESTVDMKMLEMWKSSEKRKPVMRAIQNQIKRIKGEAIEADQHSEDGESEE